MNEHDKIAAKTFAAIIGTTDVTPEEISASNSAKHLAAVDLRKAYHAFWVGELMQEMTRDYLVRMMPEEEQSPKPDIIVSA
jgi:hypothetical protein